jgi:hypothetical protein
MGKSTFYDAFPWRKNGATMNAIESNDKQVHGKHGKNQHTAF